MSKQTLKDVKGHGKLEVRGLKGKLSLSLEGIKPSRDKRYKLYAVTDEEHGLKEVGLGPVSINENARGKLDLNFNSKSVNKSEIGINNFNILLLKEEDLLEGDTNTLLAGYIHTDDGSLAKLRKDTPKAKPKEVKKEKKNKVKEAKKEENKESIEDLVKEDLKDLKTKVYVKKKDRKDCKSDMLESLKTFNQVRPFKEDLQNENFKWWEIDEKLSDEENFLPYYKYICDQECKAQIDKYNKYLFGLAEDEGKTTHYIYGIPGRHERDEHPHGGKTGFVTWLEDKTKDRNGYWLIYIDAQTGSVVRPI